MASATQDEYRALRDGWLLLQLFLHLEVGGRHDKGQGKIRKGEGSIQRGKKENGKFKRKKYFCGRV